MFDYPLRRQTVPTRLRSQQQQMREERRKPVLPDFYVYVGVFVAEDDPGNDPPVTTWQSPVWQNNFTWVGTRYVGFRHGLDGDTEFIGMLDLTQGAVTGTVAFTLPVPWRGLTFDFVFPIMVSTTEWINGIMSVNGDSTDPNWGDCTVYWPVQATPI